MPGERYVFILPLAVWVIAEGILRVTEFTGADSAITLVRVSMLFAVALAFLAGRRLI
jgi:hypothetical protein